MLLISRDFLRHDVIWISLHSKPDWYLEFYPIGKVPLLITREGQLISESDEIMRHLDEYVGRKHLVSLCGEAEFLRAEKLVSKVIPIMSSRLRNLFDILFSTAPNSHRNVSSILELTCFQVN